MKSLRFCAAFLALMASCAEVNSYRYRSYPSNPYKEVKKVAILPIVNETEIQINDSDFERLLGSELTKFGGFEVVRAVAVRSVLAGSPDITSEKNLKWLGKALKVDAVMQLRITDYDPYYPPRMSVFVNLIRTESPKLASPEDIDRLASSPTWAMSRLNREVASYVITQFEMTFDTHADSLRAKIDGFDVAHNEIDYAFNETGSATMYVQRKFWEFVCTEVIRELISRGQPSREVHLPVAAGH